MPRAPRFTDANIKAEAMPGKPLFVRDTPGLYVLTSTGKKRKQRFSYRYTDPDTGRVNTKSLGPYPQVLLEMAKNRANQATLILQRDKINPFKSDTDVTEGRTTFGEVAREWIASRKFKNAKQRRNVENLLLVYCKDLLGKPILKIKPADIHAALVEHWGRSPGQVRRALTKIERVFAYAKVKRWYFGENPARWKEVQVELFGEMPETEDEHHPSMPYPQVPEFFSKLCQSDPAALLLMLQILTTTRPGEARGMKWSEIDWENRKWVIPKARMKKGKHDHIVHLSDLVIDILKRQRQESHNSQYVFPGMHRELDRPMEEKTTRRLMRAMGISPDEAVPHGFRSSFRDWCDKQNFGFPGLVHYAAAEKCLAHTVNTKTVGAYARDPLLDERQVMLNAWVAYCESLSNDGNR
jgi:integrase